jgi:hypothetical protein
MKTCLVEVEWICRLADYKTFDHSATIQVKHYGDTPKESSIKKELRSLGLATKPIKNIRWNVI